MGTLHDDQYTFLIISRSVFLRMRDFSDERCRANQNTHAKFNNIFFEIRAVEKYCRAGEATEDNMAHGHFMVET